MTNQRVDSKLIKFIDLTGSVWRRQPEVGRFPRVRLVWSYLIFVPMALGLFSRSEVAFGIFALLSLLLIIVIFGSQLLHVIVRTSYLLLLTLRPSLLGLDVDRVAFANLAKEIDGTALKTVFRRYKANVRSWRKTPKKLLKPRSIKAVILFAVLGSVFTIAILSIFWWIFTTIGSEGVRWMMRIMSYIGPYALIPIFIVPYFFFGLFRVYLKADARSVVNKNPEGICVYLRPFDSDELALIRPEIDVDDGAISHRLLEDVVFNASQPIGSFVAIGSPQDKIPTFGANRAYFEDDEWKDRIGEWLDLAKRCVLVLGPTEHVRWEVNEVLSRPLKRDTIFLFQPGFTEDGLRLKFANDLYSAQFCFEGTEWEMAINELPNDFDGAIIGFRIKDGGQIEAVTANPAYADEYLIALLVLWHRMGSI